MSPHCTTPGEVQKPLEEKLQDVMTSRLLKTINMAIKETPSGGKSCKCGYYTVVASCGHPF